MFPNKTQDGYVVVVYRISDLDSSKMHHDQLIKAMAMIADMLLSKTQCVNGYVLIFDMKYMGLSHLTRFKLHVLRAVFAYYQVGISN